MFVTDTRSETFHYDLYSTLVTVFTYVLPTLILPLSLPIATLRTCVSRQCCVPRFKQPIGELIMSSIVGLTYLGTVVGVLLPKIAEMINLESVSRFLLFGSLETKNWNLLSNSSDVLYY